MDLLYTRPETFADVTAVRRVHEAAFPTPVEARLVDQLRARGKAVVSLVAERAGEIVGHVLFSPVEVDSVRLVGLRNEYGADDAFQVIELSAGSIPPAGGLVKYTPEFAEL